MKKKMKKRNKLKKIIKKIQILIVSNLFFKLLIKIFKIF